MTFDPRRISYDELLEVFWNAHPYWLEAGPTRVATAVFAAEGEQLERARASAAERRDAASPVLPAGRFWPAERLHQKFHLQRMLPDLVAELEEAMPAGESFLDTALAARVHAYLGGFAAADAVRREAAALGLDGGALLARLDAALAR